MLEDSTRNENKPGCALRVLPEETSLRTGSPFLDVLDWEHSKATPQPRALRGLAQIVSGGLCHRCGSCVGICPTETLGVDAEGYPRVKALSACTDCDLCVKVCPGDELDVPRLFRERYGKEADLRGGTHGHFEEAFIAYAEDPMLREHSTSGGLITALLLYLLEQKEIDGAVVIVSDPEVLWRGRPIIARTREELLSSMKSKYAIAPTNSVFGEIRAMPGRYALVGLPCQIHGFVKAAELDAKLRERVVLTVGLYCHAAVEHQGYDIIWDSLGDKAAHATRFISRVGKHPGTPHLLLDDGSHYPVYFGWRSGYRPSSIEVINILYRLYSPARCLTCFDASSEFADIAVGDPWMAPPADDVDFHDGWSFALVRSAAGQKACAAAAAGGAIVRRELTRNEALACNIMMSKEKRWRAFRIIETHKRQGKPVPAYGPFGMEMPRQRGLQFLKTEVNMLTHAPCFMPRLRAPLLRFMLSDGGYWLFWLNHKRRSLRNWLRDTSARIRRSCVGRR